MAKEIISGVYKIQNKIDLKLYIGSSKDIYYRWENHIKLLKRNKHHSPHLQFAWNKYGEENFEFSIIERCSQDELINLEQKYIDKYESYKDKNGYNIMSKADLSEIPQYVKDKISNTLTGRYCGVDSPSNKYSEEIILSLINDLMDVNNTYEFLSEKYSVPYSFVGAIATHRIWKHLTENITFPKRKSTRTYCKLNEEKVCEIIQYILDGYQNRDIAEIYGVTPRTISDIRNHKTWRNLTESIVFPNGQKGNFSNNDIINIKNMISSGISDIEISNITGASISYVNAIRLNKRRKNIKILEAM